MVNFKLNKKLTNKLLIFLVVFFAAFLRLYRLGSLPPSLYWDEVSLGYNAFSILKTGHGEHGEKKFPLDRFIAFGDYKPPGYIYATVPSIAIFGLNEFSVRLPSALAGIGTIILTYFLAQEFFKSLSPQNSQVPKILGLISVFLLTISPWHIHMSRAAFEANLALFFNTLALLTFFKGIKKSGWWLILSSFSFMLAFYTFNANRIISLLLAVGLGIFYFKKIIKKPKFTLLAIFLALVMALPSFRFLTSTEGSLRFKEVSIFNNLEPLKRSNQQIFWLGNSWWARIVFNRRVAYSWHFLKHMFDHFNFDYLFFYGDRNPRFSTGQVGTFYLFSLPLLVYGGYLFFKSKNPHQGLIVFWLFASLLPSSLAKETPHALRTLSLIPLPFLISGLGAFEISKKILKTKKTILKYSILSVSVLTLFFSVTRFLHIYWAHWPQESASEWQYGYKQLVSKVSGLEKKYDRVVITKAWGRPYVNMLFHLKYPPQKYWQTRDAFRDVFGLWHVEGFDKYLFGLEKIQTLEAGHILVAAQPNEIPEKCSQVDSVKSMNGESIMNLCEISK